MGKFIALREWAVAIRALEEGRQIIVLRKGGIAEETKEFKLESPHFYLFPSYEHQKTHLVKTESRDAVNETQAEAAMLSDQVRITAYAEVTEDIEITDIDMLHRLEEHHIWTEDYAEERLKWKRTKPLHMLILRVYKLDAPVIIPMLDGYGGCKSWLWIEDMSSLPMKPVMSDNAFQQQVDVIKSDINK